jgi:site-specific DNA recombinase
MEIFERKKIVFVSVTQPFNTSTSMGRLLLNVLLSFAQFERELISERTRDKVNAARRKGKWIGGRLPLGYDLVDGRLVVNPDEAKQVCSIFRLYLEQRSLLRVCEILNGRGWRMKSWTTQRGVHHEGSLWEKASIRRVLTNVIYLGKVALGDEILPGEHQAIVDEEVFNQVALVLESHKPVRGGDARNAHGFLLRGLIRCRACGSIMTSDCARPKGGMYRYYACTSAARRGQSACPVRRVPAETIEQFVVQQIRGLGGDPELIEGVVAEVAGGNGAQEEQLAQEARRLSVEHGRLRAEAKHALALLAEQKGSDGSLIRERLGELDERADHISARLAVIRETLIAIERASFSHKEIAAALALFVPVWEALHINEQTRILRLLIESVDYDGVGGELALNLRPAGVRLLAREAGAAGKSEAA